MNETCFNKIMSELKNYAEKNEILLNPDKKVTDFIIKSLLEREKKFGQKYCPCRKISGDAEEDKKIICPCIYHLEEIKKDGHCLCRLFVKNV